MRSLFYPFHRVAVHPVVIAVLPPDSRFCVQEVLHV